MEEAPEEPELQEPPPDETREACVQSKQPQHDQEPSTQFMEPVKEPVGSPVEPAQRAAPSPLPPAAGLGRNSVEPAGAELQPEAEDQEIVETEGGAAQVKNTKEEEEEGGCVAPEPVKEENSCEQQDGMSTQQVQLHQPSRGVL